MAQFVRPIADLDNTGVWTTAPLWSKIDDPVGSGDADFISSDTSPTSTEVFTVDGSTATDPASSIGHVLRVRASKTAGGANNDVMVELRQGYVSEASQGTLIATLTGLMTTATITTFTLNLSGAQADAITNYADLQFRCWQQKNGGGANSQGFIYDIELEIPDAGAATYDESISLSSNATLSPTNIMDLVASATLSASAQILNSNNAIYNSDVSITAESQIAESGGLNFESSIALAIQSALSTSLNVEINAGVTVISNSLISASNNADLNNVVAIASSPGIFVNGNLNMDATLSLLANAIIQSNGGSVFEASIGISSSATITALLEAILDANITLGSLADILSGANINANDTISIGSNNILSVSGGLDVNANVSFGSIVGILASGGLSLDENITLSMVASIDQQNNNIANVSIIISSASLISVAVEGGTEPIKIIISAKVPIGKQVDRTIIGSYLTNEVKGGKYIDNDKKGKIN